MEENLITENYNETTLNIDELSAEEIVKIINEEDKKVALAVEKTLPEIAEASKKMAERFEKGGRIIYIGAGSSGRVGVMDAVELQPTYGVSNERAFGILAGGKEAMEKAVEGAEDSETLAINDLKKVDIKPNDTLIGIAASGRTPYTNKGLEYGRQVGALTIAVTSNADSKIGETAEITIAPIVGPEVIMGSTRMKAGTAQKMVLNMLSTTTMILVGKVYKNYMVNVDPTNEKLIERSTMIIHQLTSLDRTKSLELLNQANNDVASAIIMHESKLSYEEASRILEDNENNLRKAMNSMK